MNGSAGGRKGWLKGKSGIGKKGALAACWPPAYREKGFHAAGVGVVNLKPYCGVVDGVALGGG